MTIHRKEPRRVSAVAVPDALRPATLRAGMALAVAAALAAFVIRLALGF